MGFFNVQIGNTLGFFKISEPDISGFVRIFRSYRNIADVLEDPLRGQKAENGEVKPDTHSHRNLFLNKHFKRAERGFSAIQ